MYWDYLGFPKKKMGSRLPTPMEPGAPQIPHFGGIWGVPGIIGEGPSDPQIFLGKSRKSY